MKFLKTLVIILITIIFFDLFINLILPENLKKRIGTSRNYSLKSEQFHHDTAPNINVYEFWGNKIILFYVPKTKKDGIRLKLNNYARDCLGSIEQPDEYIEVDKMPKTSIGKIIKKDLVKLYKKKLSG